MSKLVKAIEDAIKHNHKNNYLNVVLELNDAGNPGTICVSVEGNIITRLGMIDVIMRQLEEIRESLHEQMDEDSQEKVTKGNHGAELSPLDRLNSPEMLAKIERLPSGMKDSVKSLIEELKQEIGNDPKADTEDTKDVKKAFVKNLLEQINKRFGFEGNSIKINP